MNEPMTDEELQEAVDRLASHPAFAPWIGDKSDGFVRLDGEFNAAQLRIVIEWLEADE